MNYKLLISYDGKNHKGWQRLNNQPSVQGKIEDVLSVMFGHKITINGAGRTDGGVHAKMQVASFKAAEKPAEDIKRYLNKYLPEDISVYDVSVCDERFHARYSAKSKVYEYTINFENRCPFIRKYSLFLETKPDIAKMKEASEHFIGTHDFAAFSNAKSKKKSTVRTVYSIDISCSENIIKILIHADGFLYNMARKIVGALLECSFDEMNISDIDKMFESGERNLLNTLAPAHGLCLKEVVY